MLNQQQLKGYLLKHINLVSYIIKQSIQLIIIIFLYSVFWGNKLQNKSENYNCIIL